MEGVQSYFYTDNEVQSIQSLLVNAGVRPDGRMMDESRPVIYEFSRNSAIVRLGRTIVSCVTTPELASPSEERPAEGIHQLSLSSPRWMNKDFQTEVLVNVRDCLHRTRALDLESLVVRIGEQVWRLRSEIVILDNDGGLFEAVNMAVIGSLLHTMLPGSRGLRPIVLHHLPFAVSFGFLDYSKLPSFDRNQSYTQPLCVVDPTFQESVALNGMLTVFVNAQNEICAIHKNGGVSLSSFIFPFQSDTHVNMAIETALKIAKKWHLSLMQQMGKNAPPSLAKLVLPTDFETDKDQEPQKQTELNIQNIEEEVRNEFKQEAEATKDDEDESEMINPALLSLFST